MRLPPLNLNTRESYL